MTDTEKPTLAIIGGGQLGMFLCEAARKLGVRTVAVTPSAEDPINKFADLTLVEPFDAEGLAAQLAEIADYVTFELEAVADRLLHDLAAEEARGTIRVRPGAAIMQRLKSKIEQKAWLQDSGFPIVPFQISEHPPRDSRDLVAQLGIPMVQKASSGGYDGYGVQVIRSEDELGKLWDVPSIIEPCLPEPVELSVVVARSSNGKMAAFHAVEMRFDHRNNILESMVTPTRLGNEVDRQAIALARKVIQALDGIGIFAVEMFWQEDGKLLINEISPRVHNSGHHTLDVGNVSQFEQHVRAVCDLPLVAVEDAPPVATMRNLLYSDELAFLVDCPPGSRFADESGVRLHWYGKQPPRPGRKMGHVTCLCPDPVQAEQRIARFMRKLEERIQEAAA